MAPGNKEILIKLDNRKNQDAKIKILEDMGYKFVKDACVLKVIEIEIPEDMSIPESISEISKLDFVEHVEEDCYVRPEDTDLDSAISSLKGNQYPKILEKTKGSSDIEIAVIDSGVDYKHEMLEDVVDEEESYDFVNDSMDSYTPEDNGTHVAYLCSGFASNDNDTIHGASHYNKIIGMRVFGDNGGDLEPILEAIEYAAGNHPKGKKMDAVDIINMSLGTARSSRLLEEALQDAKDAGCIIVAATGNDGNNSVSYPARYDSVIGCSAVDKHGNLADFSNYGPGTNIAAMGVENVAALPNNRYGPMSGTSMSTPIISGFIGLLLDMGIDKEDVTNCLYYIANNEKYSLSNQQVGNGVIDFMMD